MYQLIKYLFDWEFSEKRKNIVFYHISKRLKGIKNTIGSVYPIGHFFTIGESLIMFADHENIGKEPKFTVLI